MSSEPVSLLCQYGTGILSPGEGGRGGTDGGEDGPRRAEGKAEGKEGGEREGESKCRSCAVPAVLGH